MFSFRRPVRKGTNLLAWAGLLALLLAHLDVWRPLPEGPYFGWMPEELLFRLLWMGAAWIYLLWFCARVWREED